jgi:hypothetical protein
MPMGSVVMIVGVRVAVGLVDQLAGPFVTAVAQHDIHLGGAEAAAVDLLDVNADVGQPQTIGKAFDPPRGSACSDEGAKKHVPADPCRRIQNGKASI